MQELSDALATRVDTVEEATETFRDAVLDYHALADTQIGTDTQIGAEADQVVDAWMAVETERKQLDAVVRDIGATFHITVADEDGREETVTLNPDTLSGFLQATYGSVRNVTDLEPHPRYTEEDAAHLLAALDENYTALAAADQAYIETLDRLAPYTAVIEEKQERSARETALDEPYRDIDRVLARRTKPSR